MGIEKYFGNTINWRWNLLYYLRTNYLIRIKHKLIGLYLLNVLDILFTLILLNTGMFIEINPIMTYIVSNTWLSILVKVLLPALLLLVLSSRIQNASINQLKVSHKLINIILAFYCSVNISHISLYLLFK